MYIYIYIYIYVCIYIYIVRGNQLTKIGLWEHVSSRNFSPGILLTFRESSLS